MDFNTVIDLRRSTRSFKNLSVEDEMIQQIVSAVNKAPSAGNLQAFELYLVRDLETRKELAKASYDQDFISQAPIVFVFCTNPDRNQSRYGQRGVELYSIQDATIACTYAMLAARNLGLGSVWVGAFQPDTVQKVMKLPQNQLPVALIPIGHPTNWPEPRSRRVLSELVHEY